MFLPATRYRILFFGVAALLPGALAGAAHVRIFTEPAGAEVYVESARVGVTGLKGLVLALPRGPVSVTIEKLGYLKAERSLFVGDTDLVFNVRLLPDPQAPPRSARPVTAWNVSAPFLQLRVFSEPAGAEVYAGGRRMGVTGSKGLVLDLPSGPGSLSVQKAGYRRAERNVVVGDSDLILHVPLLPEDRAALPPSALATVWRVPAPFLKVRIFSEPSGAEVYTGSMRMGVTGPKGLVLDLPSGPVSLSIQKVGYERVDETLLVADSDLVMHVRLLPGERSPLASAAPLARGEGR